LAERCRAAQGIPAFTPAGYGTEVAEGKEVENSTENAYNGIICFGVER
jgi:acyl CoA:acetate/3-ketoacid CoA transferase alpha subunit